MFYYSEPFQLKLQFAIEHRIETSTDTIIKEVSDHNFILSFICPIISQIQNGPYELIEDPDMKAIWKGTIKWKFETGKLFI